MVAGFLEVVSKFRVVVEVTARGFEVVKARRGCATAWRALRAWWLPERSIAEEEGVERGVGVEEEEKEDAAGCCCCCCCCCGGRGGFATCSARCKQMRDLQKRKPSTEVYSGEDVNVLQTRGDAEHPQLSWEQFNQRPAAALESPNRRKKIGGACLARPLRFMDVG